MNFNKSYILTKRFEHSHRRYTPYIVESCGFRDLSFHSVQSICFKVSQGTVEFVLYMLNKCILDEYSTFLYHL